MAAVAKKKAVLKKHDNSILTKIENFIQRFVVLPHEHQYKVLSTWVIHTWAFESAKTTPYLYVHSPEKQSGKSLLLDVLSPIVQNPMNTIDATGPVLFHAIEERQLTIMFDEVDAIWSGAKNEGLRGILNGGYKLGGKVWRMASASEQTELGSKVKAYNTFCPKVLAGIHNGYLPDTLVDRCIPITMRRKQTGVDVEPFMASEEEERGCELVDEIVEWVLEHEEALDEYRQHPVEGLSDREAEIAWPLLAIANEFGIKDEISEAIVSMVTEYHELTDETDKMIETIHVIGELFEQHDRSNLFAYEVLRGLGMGRDKRSAMELADFLSKYDIAPKQVRVGNTTNKGYSLEMFDKLFGMYDIKVSINGHRGRNSRNRVSS